MSYERVSVLRHVRRAGIAVAVVRGVESENWAYREIKSSKAEARPSLDGNTGSPLLFVRG